MRYVIMLCTLAVVLAGSATQAQDGKYYLEEIPVAVPAGPDFPRLAMWYADDYRYSIEECAAYDVLVGNFEREARMQECTFGEALKQQNSDIVLLTYYTNAVVRYNDLFNHRGEMNPYMPDWPAGWFLTEAGAELASTMDEQQTFINVTGWRHTGESKRLPYQPDEWDIFRTGYDVLCAGEIMRVTGTNPDRMQLTVERGINGTTPGIHHVGLRIAPLVRFWSNSCMMNLSGDCPTAVLHGATEPETWAEYSLRMSKQPDSEWFKFSGNRWFYYTGGEQDGFLFDLMADTISWVMWTDTRCVDIDQDNVPDKFDQMDETWLAGINELTEMFHRDWPGKPILRNQSRGRRMADYNGENFESWPRDAWQYEDLVHRLGNKTKYWHRQFLGYPEEERAGVLEFAGLAAEPNYTLLLTCHAETDLDSVGQSKLLNAGTLNLFTPDCQKMRWGLTSALLAGTYYGFEIHTGEHGRNGLLWFDEYNQRNGRRDEGRGYLGQPVSGVLKLLEHEKHRGYGYPSDFIYGVWGREYQHGFVICNPLDYEAEVPLPPGRWQRLAGVQDPAINSSAIEEGKVRVGAFDGLILLRAD